MCSSYKNNNLIAYKSIILISSHLVLFSENLFIFIVLSLELEHILFDGNLIISKISLL